MIKVQTARLIVTSFGLAHFNFSQAKAESIQRDGYYIKKNFLEPNQIDCILKDLLNQKLLGKIDGMEVSKGRLHYNLLQYPILKESLYIKEVLTERVLLIAETEMGLDSSQLVMTEFQIVDSLPG
jgi:hypothetical protein